MAKAKASNEYASLRYDLTAAALLGTLAGLFAIISATGAGVINTVILGITLSPVLVFSVFLVMCVVGILVGRFLGRFIAIMYKFVKFGEAGGLNWLVDLGVINLLMLTTGLSGSPWASIFKAISFTVAVTNSYFWNKLWVFFGHKKQDQTKEVGKFVTASLIGLGFNFVVFTGIIFVGPMFFSGFTSIQWANIATIIGSLSAMIFNFVLYKIWVFKD
jgi:putative flippase GtrA